jgi:CheY-like chemotaxis protein
VPIRVLLVDDEPDMRMLVRLLLDKTEDIDVVGEATSGEEAVDRTTELSPDCLLLDYMMPGSIDGIETTRRIRDGQGSGRRPAIVMFTAWASPQLREMAEEVGVDLMLSKDEFNEVAGAVRKVMTEPGSD